MSYSYVGEITEIVPLTIEKMARAIGNATGNVMSNVISLRKEDKGNGVYEDTPYISNDWWDKFKKAIGAITTIGDAELNKYLMAWLPEYKYMNLPKIISRSATADTSKILAEKTTTKYDILPSGEIIVDGSGNIDWMKYLKYGSIAGIGFVGLYFLYNRFSKRG